MQDHHIPTPDTGRRLRAPETWDAARAGETQRRLAVHVRLAEHARDAQREALRSERELHQLHQLHRARPQPPHLLPGADPLSLSGCCPGAVS